MSAAAARRKKQLAARAAASNVDVVKEQLDKLLFVNNEASTTVVLSEEVAYEALQLAQSSIRKRIQQEKYSEGCDLAYQTALALLQKEKVSIASQLLQLLADILRETHTVESDEWIQRIIELHTAHQKAIVASVPPGLEHNRLQRLQRSWLLLILKWSSELGTIKYGHNSIHELLGTQCWTVATTAQSDDTGAKDSATAAEIEEEIIELQCDAVQHMALAERPDIIIGWLQGLPKPTKEQITAGHDCPPALRDMLLTRTVLVFCAVENLRDANTLVRTYVKSIEERPIETLAKSYTAKDDGFAPSHIVFCNMLVRICEKDIRTGPLYNWLLKSFKREFDYFYKGQAIISYHTKIGKIYFGIEPPPSMLQMMEQMMGGGGAGGGLGNMLGGMDPRMMQAAIAQMQQG